jgi:hypothetical protein
MISFCFILFLLISILTSSYGQVTCASGWSQYGGNCYLIMPVFNNGSSIGTWDQCNAYCPISFPGATMLCINNAAENEWIRSQSRVYVSYWIWIGYTAMLPYGGGKGSKQYGWITGCTSTYTNWAAGEPNNMNNNQDYVGVHDSLWSDGSPQSQCRCACQYNPAVTMTPSFRPSTSYPSVALSSGSSSTATPSFSSSLGDISE